MRVIRIKEYISFGIPVMFFYFFLYFCNIGCPFYYITGIPCAGCGMTRAWISLLHLDIKKAYYYHPLFILPLIFIICFAFKNRIPHKIYTGVVVTIILLFITVYLVRLTNPENTVVVINIKKSLIWHLLNFN